MGGDLKQQVAEFFGEGPPRSTEGDAVHLFENLVALLNEVRPQAQACHGPTGNRFRARSLRMTWTEPLGGLSDVAHGRAISKWGVRTSTQREVLARVGGWVGPYAGPMRVTRAAIIAFALCAGVGRAQVELVDPDAPWGTQATVDAAGAGAG